MIVATGGSQTVLPAKSATSTIPIVFVIGTDPVQLGLVPSFNQPDGNIAPACIPCRGLTAKRLELLHQIVPASTSIGFLVNPTAKGAFEPQIKEAEIAARTIGVNLAILNASTPSEIEAAFRTLGERRIGALVVSGDEFLFVRRNQLAALAARHAVPTIYNAREWIADTAGLMSYGAGTVDAWRLGGNSVGRILKGDKPADLPCSSPLRSS